MPEIDPAREWRRLAEIYSQKYDSELLRLYEEIDDLTFIAQEALRAEIQNRHLELSSRTPGEELQAEEETAGDGNGDESVTIRQFEYREEAVAASRILAGVPIESWIEAPDKGGNEYLRYWRLCVSESEAEHALRILPKIIPGFDTLERIEDPEPEEFQAPPCPGCGARNSMLEPSDSDEPVNHWFCESCGRKWEEKLAEDI